MTNVALVLKQLALAVGLLQQALAASPTLSVPPMPVIEPPPVLAYLDRLIDCESGGKRDLKVLDTNGKYSYGTLQFQLATFNKYGEKYNLPHDDIMSRGQQIAIATQMLQERAGWRNWYNCATKVGMDKIAP